MNDTVTAAAAVSVTGTGITTTSTMTNIGGMVAAVATNNNNVSNTTSDMTKSNIDTIYSNVTPLLAASAAV